MFPGHSLAAVVPVQTPSHKTDILRAAPPFLLSICSPHSYTPPLPSFLLSSAPLICSALSPFSPPVLTYFFLFPPLHLLLSSSHLSHPFTSLLTPVLFSPVAQFVPLSSFSCLSIVIASFFSLCFFFFSVSHIPHPSDKIVHVLCYTPPPRLLSPYLFLLLLNPMKEKKDKKK